MCFFLALISIFKQFTQLSIINKYQMGACLSKNLNNQSLEPKKNAKVFQSAKKLAKFNPLEIAMLQITYQDLAKRCRDNIVTRDTFQMFFHANGLMAQLMFYKFDKDRSGTISKEQFMHAFQIMVKGSFEQKVSALFQFYSVQRSYGIGYAELLRILFSYPLEDLNNMLFQENFLKELGDRMITYYFGPEKKILEKTILEENSEDSQELSVRKGSVYIPSSSEFIEIHGRLKQILDQQNKTKISKTELPQIFKKQKSNLTAKATLKHKNSSGSMTLIQLKKIRKTGKLKSNISSVTKRYATYLFTSLNLDKDKDLLTKRQFCDLLQAHPSIFNAYLAGFHTYIWQIGPNGKPEYLGISSQVEGFAKLLSENIVNIMYLRLKKTTLFIFQNDQTDKVQAVICLEGLIVQLTQTLQGEQALRIKHRDKFYPEKLLVFMSQKQKWIKELAHYKQESIFEDYLKLQRIGKGNFSNVFRGKQKKTGNLVAVKVIQLGKLNKSEKQVLKREIGILKQCHHPNIVKFIQQYRTSQQIYIVTELLSQGDLFQYTRKNTFLQEYQAALIFRQLTQAILYLNEDLGIIHRDLKPQNVMIKMTQDKKMVHRVKLIDFGFGVYKDKLDRLTEAEKYAGTPGFIAPEVYLRQTYNQQIDTFSLGIILYFMLYGYLPFQSNYLEQIQEQTVSCSISLNNHHWSNVSKQAKDLIYKILTFADSRITTKQILQHSWLRDIQHLKDYRGNNKKKIRILD